MSDCWRTKKGRGGRGGQDGKQWGDGDAHYVDGCAGFTGVYMSNIVKGTLEYVPFIAC